MKKNLSGWLLFIGLILIASSPAWGSDSIRVERLLRQSCSLPADSNKVLFFARQLLGTAYVANTLDAADEERLVVSLDRVDCTTFVETVLALAVTAKDGQADFGRFKRNLERIRYRNGKREGYNSRLHYFSDWIKDNERKGIVCERTQDLPGVQPQTLYLDFMSTHSDSYRPLKKNPRLMEQLLANEHSWHNVTVYYLPKEKLHASPDELGVRNGDLLAITTRIKGLDVVHTGFACRKGGKLHLLHASSVVKRVILDPQPLYDYSKDKKTHTGVRVISFSY